MKILNNLRNNHDIWFHYIKETNGLRLFLYIKNDTFKIEISWLTKFCHNSITFKNGEGEITYAIAFPPVALWISFESSKLFKLYEKILSKYEDRELGIHIHDGAIWWTIWADPHSWSTKIPKWKQGNFNFINLILGKIEYCEELIKQQKVEIPMPEGKYQANIKYIKSQWHRKR